MIHTRPFHRFVSRLAILGIAFMLLAVKTHASEITSSTAELRVMTFNVRYDTKQDGLHSWPLRAHLLAATVRLYDPDILGLQEAYWRQAKGILDRVPGYESFGKGRDNGIGERCTLLYKTDRFTLLRHDTFWLSKTPEKSGRSWDAALPRIATWGEFRDQRSGKTFFVFNTHFDHRGKNARLESARLLVHRINELAGDTPCILMGDFNCTEDSAPYQVLAAQLQNTRLLSRTGHAGSSGTCHGFDGLARPGHLIDFIFVKNNIDVLQHVTVSDAWDGRSPSDHRPVLADLLIGVPPTQPLIELHENWRFSTDPEGTGLKQGFHTFDFDDQDWPLIHIGRPWEQQGFEGYDGTAYYRKRVHIPQSWQEREKILLVTCGMDDAFTVYINGAKVAQAGSPTNTLWNRETVVELPTQVFGFGAENQIVIAVDDIRGNGGILGWPCRLTTENHPVTIRPPPY